jgi:hypothetical protein
VREPAVVVKIDLRHRFGTSGRLVRVPSFLLAATPHRCAAPLPARVTTRMATPRRHQ